MRVEEGAPQGGSASPLPANRHLHPVFDLRVQAWRRKRAQGDIIVVRFAEDIVAGFQRGSDGRRFWSDLTERFRESALEPHHDQTRLPEFGRFAAEDRNERGEGKRETFNFPGFPPICGRQRRNGWFPVLRQTMRKRVQAKLTEVKIELQRRMHGRIPEVGQWLRSVVSGHFRYSGVPMNTRALQILRFQTGRLWHCALPRRSPNGRVFRDRMRRWINRWLPPVCVQHDHPPRRVGVVT
ncbi:MAG: RNA-directed DNA polymerase [Bryobacteraceae bacterium]